MKTETVSDLDKLAKKRLNELKSDLSVGAPEEELDAYLKQRGVNVVED